MPYHTHATRDILKLDEIHQFIMDSFVAAGYGSISLADPTPLLDIDATWQKIPFDTAAIAVPKGVVYDLPANGITVNVEGIWTLSLTITLSFAEAQAGRTLQIRSFNTDLATGATPIQSFVGRNTAGHTVTFSLPVEISPAAVGDVFVVEISSATDTFTTVQAEAANWSLTHSSEYKGALP